MERIAWPSSPHTAHESQTNRAPFKYLCLEWWTQAGAKFGAILGPEGTTLKTEVQGYKTVIMGFVQSTHFHDEQKTENQKTSRTAENVWRLIIK